VLICTIRELSKRYLVRAINILNTSHLSGHLFILTGSTRRSGMLLARLEQMCERGSRDDLLRLVKHMTTILSAKQGVTEAI
jgi:hypothetical protein